MPNTIYGMLKASRSHELTSPHVAAQLETGRTNACNLCRLDRIDALLKRRDNRLMKLGE